MSKRDPRQERSDRDVLDNLGALIGGQLKKGKAKLEEMIAEAKEKSRRKDEEKASRKHGRNGEGKDKFMSYFKVFLDDRSVASITPSSKYIVERVVKAMALEDAKVVVEYGAAQGVITKRLLEKMRADARLVAIEFNKELYDELVRTLKDPRLIAVHGDVREIDKILAKHGIEQVDAVTSGVPFAFFSSRGRHELLTKTSDMLRPGGRFVPYQVTTHLIPLLKDYFSSVDVQFEVRNIPPHFVFTAIK